MRDLSSFTRLTSGSVVSATCLLALLYFGRGVLEPLALASILSLILAPLIRSMGRIGLGRLSATLVSVFFVGTCVVGMSVILASQLVAVTDELPQYRTAIRLKLEKIRELTERPFARIAAELSAVAPQFPATEARLPHGENNLAASSTQPVPVEIRSPHLTTSDALARLVSLAWGPIGEAGLVLVLLVFMLLEHESLKDRLIRLAGQAEISRTISTLADAAQGISRFFFSQFVVNTSFGGVVGVALWGAGIPHAVLWGTLSGMLRFVPYLGVLGAGAAIALFVAAIDPGWELSLFCITLFAALELLVSNVIEPKVYGHSSGLSPLAVIVSALFWGSLWGPVGLLLSTPLTLCLVVTGRHVRALEPASILLGEAPNVTAAQRFYQRALSEETDAIIQDARAFLRRSSFARYCDQILLPGLAFAVAELRTGQIDIPLQDHIRTTIAEVAETLTPTAGGPPVKRRRRRVSLLDANVGAHLRQLREARSGRWQGSLDVPSRSVVLCAGMASERDDLLSELLVRALREVGVDARSVSLGVPQENPEPGRGELVSTMFIAYPLEENLDHWLTVISDLRSRLPQALLVTIRPPLDDTLVNQTIIQTHVDMILRSFEEGLAFVAPDWSART
jgi:predicted PurR-regulated permease PerM